MFCSFCLFISDLVSSTNNIRIITHPLLKINNPSQTFSDSQQQTLNAFSLKSNYMAIFSLPKMKMKYRESPSTPSSTRAKCSPNVFFSCKYMHCK